jgi:hypothetical protein
VRRNAATRPGKPYNATGCIEVWANDRLLVQRGPSTGPTPQFIPGELNADTGQGAGPNGTSWIDLFAADGVIEIENGDPAIAAVHANGLAAANDSGGAITLRERLPQQAFSVAGIGLGGLALQANATAAGGAGGTIAIEGSAAVFFSGELFDGATVQAVGATAGAGGQHGGHIIVASLRPISAEASSTLDVSGGSAADGIVDLRTCPGNAIAFPPGIVLPALATVNKIFACPAITFPAYFHDPICNCAEGCQQE